MAYDKYEKKHVQYKSKKLGGKAGALLISLLLIFTVMVSGTVAFLVTQTTGLTNTFTPSHVSCSVTEGFDGTTKSNVNVTNTGDTDAYIRVKLVTYRVNDQNQHIGGTATIPSFTLGTNWVQYGDYYYYTLPVAPTEKPVAALIDSIQLTGNYDVADGGKQVFEVMAEAIQSGPAEAVGNSWGVSISKGSVTAYSN